jgi:hypothetical protein
MEWVSGLSKTIIQYFRSDISQSASAVRPDVRKRPLSTEPPDGDSVEPIATRPKRTRTTRRYAEVEEGELRKGTAPISTPLGEAVSPVLADGPHEAYFFMRDRHNPRLIDSWFTVKGNQTLCDTKNIRLDDINVWNPQYLYLLTEVESKWTQESILASTTKSLSKDIHSMLANKLPDSIRDTETRILDPRDLPEEEKSPLGWQKALFMKQPPLGVKDPTITNGRTGPIFSGSYADEVDRSIHNLMFGERYNDFVFKLSTHPKFDQWLAAQEHDSSYPKNVCAFGGRK